MSWAWSILVVPLFYRPFSVLCGALFAAAGCSGLDGCAGDDATRGVTSPELRPLALNWQKTADDRAAWARFMQTSVGDSVDRAVLPAHLRHGMAGLGFVADDEHTYRRVMPAAVAPAWVPMHSPRLPQVDTIAIISIARPDAGEPYIYATLRSLFATISPDIEVNVIVGDDNPAYLAADVLAHQLGAGPAGHVHVWPATAAWADHLHEHLGVHARAAWNYSRALAGYRGSRGLLLLEDDVVWAHEAAAPLAHLLGPPSPPAISLYNFFCGRLPGGSSATEGPSHILSVAARDLPWKFSRTQTMLYQAALVAPMAHYMQLRLEVLPLDLLVGEFMAEHELTFGFAEPSMVQHIGRHTTGLGSFHASPCFPPGVYPAP